jgi:hypothetical protein
MQSTGWLTEGGCKLKPGDLVTLQPRINYSKREFVLGFVLDVRDKRTKYLGLPQTNNTNYKEYKVLVITTGKTQWFADSSLELFTHEER